MPRRCDLWRVGIVHAPIDRIARHGLDDGSRVTWLDTGPSFTFDADPFGLWRDGILHLFVEQYDYRTRHGVIDLLRFDRDLAFIGRQTVLREPWHLSYPNVFEADGAIWMLPEANRSGTLTLYRADDFPTGWQAVARLPLDGAAVDATPFRHDGRWWLFYSASTSKDMRLGSLHAAWADELTGEWHVHPGNPVRLDRGGARPGGTPFLLDGEVVLPVQDCSRTYGGAVRLLHMPVLTPERIETRLGARIAAPPAFAPYVEGLHTLAACGPFTLIDAKRVDRSGRGWLIDLARMIRGAATGA